MNVGVNLRMQGPSCFGGKALDAMIGNRIGNKGHRCNDW